MLIKKLVFRIILIILFNIIIFSAKSFTLYTENFPPVSFEENNQVKGIATELIKLIYRDSNLNVNFLLFPWARAFNTAQKENNSGVFGAYRTTEREKIFKWVGPIVDMNWSIFVLKNSKIQIKKLEDLNKYNVGGYLQDAQTEFLKQYVRDIEEVSDNEKNIIKLQKNRIDIWATSNIVGWYLARKHNIAVKEIFVMKTSPMYLALNRNTEDVIVKKLNNSLVKIKSEKSELLKKIYSSYGIPYK